MGPRYRHGPFLVRTRQGPRPGPMLGREHRVAAFFALRYTRRCRVHHPRNHHPVAHAPPRVCAPTVPTGAVFHFSGRTTATVSCTVGVIAGDGIGPEVVAEALKVVRAAGVALDVVDYDLGGSRYLRT